MSQHIVEMNEKKYVFGWDQPLMSFYLQVHNLTKDEDDEDRIPVWLGIPNGIGETVRLYEVEELVAAAQRYGLVIDHATQVKLYGEKDDGV